DTHLTLDGLIDLGRQSADLGGELTSEHPARALRHLKVDLPLNSGRLQPVLVTGEAKGTLGRFELALKAGYDQGEASIDGRAGWIEDQPWYDLKVEARHPDHLGLAGQFGLAPLVPAGDAEGPLELILGISRGSAKPWTASGNAKLGPTTFTGSLAYETEKETEGTEERTGETTAGTGPFHAKISIGTPKQDSLSPFLSLAGLKLAGAWTPERWFGRLPAVGLRTAWLDKAEGTLSLASKGGLVGDGLWLDAKLESGLLYIDRLEARPWQGKLEAELSLERRRDQPFLAVAVDLDDVQAAELAKWLGVKNGIDGSLDLRMEASSAGRTPFDMMAGLAGELAIKAGPGEISGLGIPDLRQTLASSEGDDPRVDRSLSLPFSALDIEADLGRGILTIEGGRLLFDPGSRSQAEAAIDGTLDLLLWITDLTLRPTAGKERDDEDAVFRLVGPPGQPDGYRSSGN
ncbi:MAG: AsmA-like C-terminal region-containing protein, partial [Geminicoccaceae bacterium]